MKYTYQRECHFFHQTWGRHFIWLAHACTFLPTWIGIFSSCGAGDAWQSRYSNLNLTTRYLSWKRYLYWHYDVSSWRHRDCCAPILFLTHFEGYFRWTCKDNVAIQGECSTKCGKNISSPEPPKTKMMILAPPPYNTILWKKNIIWPLRNPLRGAMWKSVLSYLGSYDLHIDTPLYTDTCMKWHCLAIQPNCIAKSKIRNEAKDIIAIL